VRTGPGGAVNDRREVVAALGKGIFAQASDVSCEGGRGGRRTPSLSFGNSAVNGSRYLFPDVQRPSSNTDPLTGVDHRC
jgi:hypothetical protein